MRSAFEVMDETASRQWSLVTRQQLLDGGLSHRQVTALLRSGTLRRIGHRVYATLGSPRSWEQRLLAVVLGVGGGAVASHASAARLWKFAHLPADAIDVTVLVERSSTIWATRRGLHRTLILPAIDVTERSGIPCTTFERTLCDCTTTLSAFQLGRVLDDGLRRHDISLGRLERCAGRLDSGPGRRLAIIKQLLAERDASFDPGGSASELRVLKLIREAGLPEPVQQHKVRIGERSFVLDYAWPDRRLLVEYYGLAVHSGASAVAYDNGRLTALVTAGWRPLVFTDTTSDRELVRNISAEFMGDRSD